MNVSYDITGTLRAQEKWHPPLVFDAQGGNVPLIIEVVEDERTDNTGIKPKPCNNQQ